MLSDTEVQAISPVLGYLMEHREEALILLTSTFESSGQAVALRVMLADPDAPRQGLTLAPAPPQRVPTLDEGERDLIVRALKATAGNKLQAARMLRISRHRLYDKLRKFAIVA